MGARASAWQWAWCGSWPIPAALAALCLAWRPRGWPPDLRLFRGVVTDTAAFGAMLPVAGAELALSLAWSPVIYLLFRSIYRRVGGTRLA